MQYRDAVDAGCDGGWVQPAGPGGAWSAATLCRDPVRCPGRPAVTAGRPLEPRLGVIDEPGVANPDRLPAYNVVTLEDPAAAVEPTDDRGRPAAGPVAGVAVTVTRIPERYPRPG